MQAITVMPGIAGSARLDEVPEPPPPDGPVLVRALALGVCATDRDIVAGHYGTAPPGQQRLILGHESLGRVEQAPAGSGLDPGDLVVGIVRRPDPVPCPACAAGEWDMCGNGRYQERGIKERHGYGAQRFRLEPAFAVKVDPGLGALGVLIEPASVVAKAWDHVERIGARTRAWRPRTVLVTGAGPIGLLAAFMGAERGLALHVLDRGRGGAKEALVRALGGAWHCGGMASVAGLAPDIVMECSGAPAVIRDCLSASAPAGIVCLTGVTAPGAIFDVDIGRANLGLVLGNRTVFGTVNANRRHYELAAHALARADRSWIAALITRRVPVERFADALDHRAGDIKTVIDFA